MILGRLARALAVAALLPGAAAAAPAPHAKPMRVMTMMLCADQYAMLLLPPARIASVTYLAPKGSLTPTLDAEAGRLPLNHGTAEEVLAQKPDLIVAGTFTTPATRALVKERHIPLIELEAVYSFDDIRRQTRLLGEAFGEQARAEALIAHMDATLAELARTAPARRIGVIAWNPGGRVPGRRSMFNAILEAAGGHNAAADRDVFEFSVDLEQLIRMQPHPDILMSSVSKTLQLGARVDLVHHPILDRAYKGKRLSYSSGAYTCSSPLSADQAVQLRADLLATMGRAGVTP